MASITGIDIQRMVTHWLNTPVNGYLGSDYGQDAKSLLQLAQNDGAADRYLQKLRNDIPLIGALPSGSVNLYSIQSTPDKLEIIIEVAGQTFTVPGA